MRRLAYWIIDNETGLQQLMMKLKSTWLALLLLTFISDWRINAEVAPELVKQQQSNQSLQVRQIGIGEEFTFKLKPKSSLLLLLNSTSSDHIFLDYLTTFPFDTCISGAGKKCKSQVTHHKTHEGSLELVYKQISEGILFTNPHATLFIKLAISIHEIKNDCQALNAKQLYRRKLDETLCFTHGIQEAKDMEIVIQSQSFRSLNYSFVLCDKNISLNSSDNNRFFVSNLMISQKCNGVQEKELTITIAPASAKFNESEFGNSHVLVVLQYPEEEVLLLDGIGYTTSLTSESPKLFLYELINVVNTTINVESSHETAIYAKIVEEEFIDDTVPSRADNHFNSKAGFVFTYFKPYLTISTEEILKYKCMSCYLVISVYITKQQPEQIVEGGKITVEVVQQYTVLSNGNMKHKYLPSNSTAYFSYSSDRLKMIYLEISDNNQYCSKVYFSDSESPSETNHILKYEKKQVVYQAKKGVTYFIGVQAISNCAFSLVIYDSTYNITYLQKGKFGFLNLDEGKSKVYLVMSDKSQYLKFLSMHVYGSVQIYLNRTSLEHINSLKSYDFNFTDFEKKGQLKNRLVLEKEEEMFCQRCYYLVAIVAKKHTESNFFFGDDTTPIPIKDKKVNDLIPKKNTIVKGEYYGKERSQFQLKVKSGKLRLKFSNEKNSYEHIFETSETMYKDKFNLELDKLFDEVIHLLTNAPIKVQFEALEDNTIYSLRMKEEEETAAATGKIPQVPTAKYRTVLITPGQDEYQLIDTQEVVCASGYLRDKNERIIITCDYSDRALLSSLEITGEIDNKKFQISIEKAQNILSISFPSLVNYLMNGGVKFNLFIRSKTAKVWLFILQEEEFSVLPSQVEVLVKKQYTFVTHTQSDLIVDLFECNGKSSMVYSSTIKKINETQQKELDAVGLSNQPHAVRISRFSTTFFKVTAPKAILRWFPMNVQKQIGTGYLDYEVGHLLYKATFNGVDFTWTSLSKAKKTESKVMNISYNLFISESEEDLKSASQCELTEGLAVYQQNNIISSVQTLKLNVTHTFSLKRDALTAIFQMKPLFATIVADVELLPYGLTNASESAERYRFIYPLVQIPEELLSASYIDHISNLDVSQIAIIILLAIVAFTIIIYVVLRKLLPLLGILKNRMLVEEREEPRNVGTEAQQGLSEVKSSDRKGMNQNNNEVAEKEQYIEAK